MYEQRYYTKRLVRALAWGFTFGTVAVWGVCFAPCWSPATTVLARVIMAVLLDPDEPWIPRTLLFPCHKTIRSMGSARKGKSCDRDKWLQRLTWHCSMPQRLTQMPQSHQVLFQHSTSFYFSRPSTQHFTLFCIQLYYVAYVAKLFSHYGPARFSFSSNFRDTGTRSSGSQ